MGKAIKNWREPLEDIGQMLESSVDQNFEDEGRPEPWEDLSPVTKAIREKEGKWPGKIGQVTGGLAGSISSSVNGLTVKVNHGKDYGDIFNFGNKNIQPGRPFMVVQDQDVKDAEKILIDHLKRAL
jgi:phage virion morphogenesis protein